MITINISSVVLNAIKAFTGHDIPNSKAPIPRSRDEKVRHLRTPGKTSYVITVPNQNREALGTTVRLNLDSSIITAATQNIQMHRVPFDSEYFFLVSYKNIFTDNLILI